MNIISNILRPMIQTTRYMYRLRPDVISGIKVNFSHLPFEAPKPTKSITDSVNSYQPTFTGGSLTRSLLKCNSFGLGMFSVRTKIRDYFPHPSEYKRIRKHGWKKRMSTRGGRMVIMRRILKGRHCLTH